MTINTPRHLAFILNVDLKRLEYFNIDTNIEKCYYEFERVKKNSKGEITVDSNNQPKIRVINPSKGKLKIIQKKILKNILQPVGLPEYCYGAAKGKDNVKNAECHKGKKYKFLTDMRNFFPLITNKMVFEMFRRIGCSHTVARILTRLTTYKGHVPQGAPTSSAIANLVFVKTGDKLLDLAKEHNITMTTFIDDLTMSSPQNFQEIIPLIIDIIELGGFTINHKKTFYKTKDPIVTGVIATQNTLKLPLEFTEKLNQTEGKTKAQINGLKRYVEKVESMNRKK